MKRTPISDGGSHLSGVVTAVVVVGTLYFARVVFVPLALALLLSLLFTPVVTSLEKLKLHRGVAIFLVVAALATVVGLLGWKTSQQFVDLTNQVPSYRKSLESKIHFLKGENTQRLENVSTTVKDLENEISTPSTGSSTTAQRNQNSSAPYSAAHPMPVAVVPSTNPLQAFETALGPLATGGIILVFTIFILLDRENLRDRFIRLAGGRRLTAMTQALDEATRRINRYLLLQMLVNTGYGIAIGTGLYFIGIPNASLWGVAATILRFIPYAGPPMAAAMPILLSLAVFDGWSHALKTVALFFILEVVVSNFVEPLLYGAHVGLSALAILVAAVFWTLIWGLPGLVLSTPLTVFIVVMGRYVPSLTFLNILLGDEPVLTPHAQFYQRLLAMDEVGAKQLLEQYLKEKSPEDLFSTVLIPALSLAELDRYHGEIDASTQGLMYQSVREMIEELGPDETTGDGDQGRVQVLCIPARDDADNVIAMALSQLLQYQGYRSTSLAPGVASEVLVAVASTKPDVVCISALPPFAMSHARELYRYLRSHSLNVRVGICLWHFEGDLQKTALRLKILKDDSLSSTLPQVLESIEAWCGPTK